MESIKQNLWDLQGMWCNNCARSIQKKIQSLPGVLDCRVSFLTSSISLEWNLDLLSEDEIEKKISSLGYRLQKFNAEFDREEKLENRQKDLYSKLAVGALFGMWTMMAAWVQYLDFNFSIDEETRWWLQVFSLCTSLPVLFYSGLDILRMAIRNLLHGILSLDVLIAFASISSFLFSLINLIVGEQNIYFDTSVALIIILLVGRLIELQHLKNTQNFIKRLAKDVPIEVRLQKNSKEEAADISQIRKGDRIRVLPGEIFPIDGILLSLTTEVDRSRFSGESEPKVVMKGEHVEAGSRNISHEVIVETQLQQGLRQIDLIAKYIHKSLTEKGHANQSIEFVLRFFLPIVIGIGLLSAALAFSAGTSWSEAVSRFFSVVIIACPCALSLAWPLTVQALSRTGFSKGILIQNPAKLFSITDRQSLFLDKTGTLTEGKIAIDDVEILQGHTEEELFNNAFVAEAGSLHPISEAIARKATQKTRPAGSIKNVPGEGIIWRSHHSQQTILVGNHRLLESSGTGNPFLEKTGIFVVKNGQVLGRFFVKDKIRSNLKVVIEGLINKGVRVYILSGDDQEKCIEIARELSIPASQVFGSLSPSEKLEKMKLYRDEDTTIFFGDGVNDGPCLAEADLGVSVEGSTQGSTLASSIHLNSGSVDRFSEILELSKRLKGKFKSNLIWASSYNLALIPIAGIGLISPSFSALAMLLSSLSVTINSFRT